MPHPYYGSWKDLKSVQEDFTGWRPDEDGNPPASPVLDTDEVLFAAYGGMSYEGAAVLLFRRDGKLYYNYGSHCSCNGLEECWGPDEVTVEAAVKLITAQLFSDSVGYSEDRRYNEEYEDDARAGWLRVAVSLGHGHLLADHAEFVLKQMAQGEHHA